MNAAREVWSLIRADVPTFLSTLAELLTVRATS